MLRWLWNTAVSLGWYVILLAGWFCWWKAHLKAQRLSRELTQMAQSLRYHSKHS